ncbi:MAG: DUF2516 family protein, partial [Actinomycetes bacterium]
MVLYVASLAVKGYALVDAAVRRADAYPAAGKKSKALWLVILGLGFVWNLVFGGFMSLLDIAGLIGALVYLVDVRPALTQVGGGPRRRGRRNPDEGPTHMGPY